MKKFKMELIKRSRSKIEVEADNIENAIDVALSICKSSEECFYEIDSIEEIIDEDRTNAP